MLIEQAIFASVPTDRAQGYQLVSRSPGISDDDARELALWGPSHDSLLERTDERASTNFHRLASGAYSVSRTTLAGAEYSGRGAEQVYTQFLVVPPEALARFANNPFALLRGALASGALCVHERFPKTLEPVHLAGHAPAVDVALLAQLKRQPGPAGMATLVQAALSSDRLAVASQLPAEQLIAGLFNVLPVECRTEFSFCTGLKFSPTRSVRLLALPNDRLQWRALGRNGITLLDLDAAKATDDVHWEGWAGCVAEILSSGKLSLLVSEFEQARPGLQATNLEEVSERIRSQMTIHPLEKVRAIAADAPAHEAAAPVLAADGATTRQRSDAPHVRRERMLAVAESRATKGFTNHLAESLAEQPPEILEMLERIDDLVFAAIAGDVRAFAELEVLWPLAAGELDENLLEQSREQYLRCALSIWNECVDGEIKRPERAVAAIDVLCVLFDE